VQPSRSATPASPSGKRWIVTQYYDRGEIEVTSDYVAVGADVYGVNGISEVRVEHRAMTGAAIVAAALMPSEVVAIILAAQGTTPHLTGVVLAVTLGVATITALLVAVVWPRTYQVLIVYRGVPTRLLTSTEEWRALQLARALRRALAERANQQPPDWYHR
jgi:Family of unknown function (DUF6232)